MPSTLGALVLSVIVMDVPSLLVATVALEFCDPWDCEADPLQNHPPMLTLELDCCENALLIFWIVAELPLSVIDGLKTTYICAVRM